MENSFAYSLGSGWALVSEPDVTGIWQNEDRAGWLVPLGGGVEKSWVVGRLAIGVGVAGYYNVVRPNYVGRFTLHTELRLFVQGLQPRRWIEDRLPWPD
jgi:hypothetical protein